mgnify:FL=1
MSKHCQHLSGLHPILLSAAERQALFMFVQGVLAASPRTTIPEAIKLFEKTFGLEDFNRKSALTKYYRMLELSMNDNKIFNYGKNKGNKAGNGTTRRMDTENMGVAR